MSNENKPEPQEIKKYKEICQFNTLKREMLQSWARLKESSGCENLTKLRLVLDESYGSSKPKNLNEMDKFLF